MSLNDVVDRFADQMDRQYGDFDNFAYRTGLEDLYQSGLRALQRFDPVAADNVDKVFGAAKIALDANGDGHITFGEIADPVKDLAGIKSATTTPAALDPAKQFEIELRMAMIQCQLQMMAAPWTPDGPSSGATPFLLPLQTAVLTTLRKALIH